MQISELKRKRDELKKQLKDIQKQIDLLTKKENANKPIKIVEREKQHYYAKFESIWGLVDNLSSQAIPFELYYKKRLVYFTRKQDIEYIKTLLENNEWVLIFTKEAEIRKDIRSKIRDYAK